MKDKTIGKHVVPIVPDEARTFGMEGMFRQIGIYSSMGQLYTPQDADQLLYYREDKKGQILEEGINEAGSMCSWIAAGTAYSNHGVNMVPFYIFYSMFGFQRVGDFCWAAGDMQARGFLIGGTAGRTTLAGEGLQHQDGHSQLVASTIPNCVAYDPTLRLRARGDRAGRHAPHVPGAGERLLLHHLHERELRASGAAEGRRGGHPARACTCCRSASRGKVRVNLLGSGTILREVLAAAELLEKEFGVPADVFSVTSFSELRRDALDAERWNLLHPGERRRTPYVQPVPRGARRAVRRGDRLHAHRSRPDPPVGARAAITCSAPTATGAAIRAPRCAASSRSTGATWRSRR